METPDIAPLFKADSATLSFYATKDGRITVTRGAREQVQARIVDRMRPQSGVRRGGHLF